VVLLKKETNCLIISDLITIQSFYFFCESQHIL